MFGTIASNEFPVDNFDCAHVPPKMLSTLYRKNKTELNFTRKKRICIKRRKRKVKRSKEKKRKKEGKKNGGPRGCPPLRCRYKLSKRKKE